MLFPSAFPDGVQLPHRPGPLSAAHAALVRRHEQLGLEHGSSFDLDFHTIPFHGEDALVEKHYVSKRSRRQKGILAFFAQDGEKRFFCYANSDLRKDQQDDEILQFVRFWKERTGKLPEELIFDSKLTTYANLHELNRQGIQFVTLRRRGPQLVHELLARPQIRLAGRLRWSEFWATDTRSRSRVICFRTSSTPPRRSRSTNVTSASNSRSALTARC